MLLPAILLATVVAADSARAASPRPHTDGATPWTTVLAYDEVRVEVDTAHLGGAGPVSAWLRWTFADRAVSPAAWDAGVRSSVDAVEVDCAAGASRTLASTGFTAAGDSVLAASYADPDAAWRRHAAASMGGRVAAAVCRLAGSGGA